MDGRLLRRVLFRGLLCGSRTEACRHALGVPGLPGSRLGMKYSLTKPWMSGSVRRVAAATVSLTSHVVCRQGSKTTFS